MAQKQLDSYNVQLQVLNGGMPDSSTSWDVRLSEN